MLKKGKIIKNTPPVNNGTNINISGIANEQGGLTKDLHNSEDLKNGFDNEINQENYKNEEVKNERDTDEELKLLFGINNGEGLF